MVHIDAPSEDIQPAEPIKTSTDINAAAFAPTDITPYELPDNQNYYKVHDGTGDGFKMGGVVYNTNL